MNSKVRQKSVKRNVLFSIIKSGATMLFPLITFPYVSRVLGAENIGKIDFSRSIINYIGLIAALGISNYAIREGAKIRTDEKRFGTFVNQIFSINMISTIISYIVLVIVYIYWTKLDGYTDLLFIFSFTVIMTTLGTDWINSIYEDYAYITFRNIALQFVSLILMLIFVRDRNDFNIYAIILTFSTVGSNVLNIFYVRQYCKLRFTLKIDWKTHLKPIFLIFAINLATVIYVNVDSTMLGAMRGDYEVGIYGAAVRVYNIVKNIVSAVVVVTVPRLSYITANKDAEDFKELAEKVFRFIIIIAFPIMVMIICLSRQIILILSGKSFEDAAIPLAILGVSLLFSSFASFMTSTILLPNNKEKYILRASIASAILNFGLNIFLIPVLGAIGAAITTMLAEMLMFAITYVSGRQYLRMRKVIKDILISLSGSVLIFGCKMVVGAYINNSVIQLLMVAVLGGGAYGIWLMVWYKIKISQIRTFILDVLNIKGK